MNNELDGLDFSLLMAIAKRHLTKTDAAFYRERLRTEEARAVLADIVAGNRTDLVLFVRRMAGVEPWPPT